MHVLRDIGEMTVRGCSRMSGAVRQIQRNMAVAALLVVAIVLVPIPLGANGERTISLYNVHTKDTLTIVYKRNGAYVPAAMKKLNWHLRDWRQNEPTNMDPALIDLVWEIHAELGSRMPVHVISGYRSPKTNNMLRKSRGGQARRSQHLLGKAMDVRFPDIPVRRLRYSALLREQGGVGYYPTSATPFVHVDTGRVRHWPRMGRQELALLFPHGRTKHRPSRGGRITREDAIAARRSNPSLAQRVAAFHTDRRNGPSTTRLALAAPRPTAARRPGVAALGAGAPAAPRLVQRPRIAYAPKSAPPGPVLSRVERPRLARAQLPVGRWNATVRPPAARPDLNPKPLPFRPAIAAISPDDRGRLMKLASAIFVPSPISAPRAAEVADPEPDQWISAPAFDEEHPEELFYRPFPIAPYITLTASADDPALQRMMHPDIDKTLELLVADGADDPALQMRPGLKTANLMWSQSFSADRAGRLAASRPMNRRASKAIGRRLVQLAGR